MTTYTAIPNGDIDQDSPVTQPLLTLMRDNPIAITEGAAGAPRILLGALERLSAGSTIKYRADAVFSITSTTFTLVTNSNISFMQAGTVRVSLEHRRGAGGASEARIRRTRGTVVTAVTTFSTTNSTFTAETADVSIQPGDILDIVLRNTNSAVAADVQNIRYSCDPANFLWPVDRYGMIENNPTVT